MSRSQLMEGVLREAAERARKFSRTPMWAHVIRDMLDVAVDRASGTDAELLGALRLDVHQNIAEKISASEPISGLESSSLRTAALSFDRFANGMDKSYEFQDLILAWLASQPADIAVDWTLQEWSEMLRRRSIGPKQFLKKAPWPSAPITTPIDWSSELHELIGLAAVKTQLLQVRDYLRVRKLRQSLGFRTDTFSLHQAFLGNPGTGKTSVARILAGIYYELGVLPRANVLEVDRSKLVGQYIGATEARTTQAVDDALGGVLFIDEAYALATGGPEDFGRVAIDVLVKAMEDHRHHLVVIVAGYTQKMSTFFDSNPGLLARFPKRIHFPDYTNEELLKIFERMASKADFSLSDDAASSKVLEQLIDMKIRNGDKFANARDVRNLWEATEVAHASRLAAEYPAELTPEMIPRHRLCQLASADIPEFTDSNTAPSS